MFRKHHKWLIKGYCKMGEQRIVGEWILYILSLSSITSGVQRKFGSLSCEGRSIVFIRFLQTEPPTSKSQGLSCPSDGVSALPVKLICEIAYGCIWLPPVHSQSNMWRNPRDIWESYCQF